MSLIGMFFRNGFTMKMCNQMNDMRFRAAESFATVGSKFKQGGQQILLSLEEGTTTQAESSSVE